MLHDLLFEPPSPYLTHPKRGTWIESGDGHWHHVETGSIWPNAPSNITAKDVLSDEIVYEDILDAEVVE